MKVEIIEDMKNPLLSRREIRFKVEHEGKATPPKVEVAKLLSAKNNLKMDLMLIKRYVTKFGRHISEGFCVVYENEEAMKSAEPQKVLNPKKMIGQKEEPKQEGEGNEAQSE